jgi:hypothetical protein
MVQAYAPGCYGSKTPNLARTGACVVREDYASDPQFQSACKAVYDHARAVSHRCSLYEYGQGEESSGDCRFNVTRSHQKRTHG